MADIKQIQVGGTNYNISGAAIVLEDNGTTTDGVWLAKTNQISSLVDGQLFLYKLVKKPVEEYVNYGGQYVYSATLTITANGTVTATKNIYNDIIWINASTSTKKIINSNLKINDTIMFVYSSSNDAFYIVNSHITSMHSYSNSYGGTYIELNEPTSTPGSSKINFGYYDKNSGSRGYMRFGHNSAHNVGELYVQERIRVDGDIRATKILNNGLVISGSEDRSSYSYGANMRFYSSWMDFCIPENESSSGDCSTWMVFDGDGLKLNRPLYIGDNDNSPNSSDSSGVQMEYNSTDDSLDFIFD